MSGTLADLLLGRAADSPSLRIGMAERNVELAAAIDAGRRVAAALQALGLPETARIAVVERPTTDYVAFWIGCQLAGVAPALINPSYPPDLIATMIDDLDPHLVVTAPDSAIAGDRTRVAITGAMSGRIAIDGETMSLAPAAELHGLQRDSLAVSGFMHTSGTTGPPKFCAQSHAYFLRLGDFVTRSLALTTADTVLAPLPLFHINPLGYGFIGSLVAGASVVGLERFVPEEFWGAVRHARATVLVLHGPPVRVLQDRTDPADADGHEVRTMFYADLDFLRRFGIGEGVSGYGSTEVGGLSHAWRWPADADRSLEPPEGTARYGGEARDDIEARVADDGQILVRERLPGTIFSGYWRSGRVEPTRDSQGWFHTGDLGRIDDRGNLVFVERRSESIRVRGEYVPIDYVEGRLHGLPGLRDAALWKEPGATADDIPLLYVAGDEIPIGWIRSAMDRLPRYMRPVSVIEVERIPRDSGAGKVQRRELPGLERLRTWAITPSSDVAPTRPVRRAGSPHDTERTLP